MMSSINSQDKRTPNTCLKSGKPSTSFTASRGKMCSTSPKSTERRMIISWTLYMTGKFLSAALLPACSTQTLNKHPLFIKLRPEREPVHNPLLPRPGWRRPESLQSAPKPDRHPLHIQQQSWGFARPRRGRQAEMRKLRQTKNRPGPFPRAGCPHQRATKRRDRSLKTGHKLPGTWRRNSIPGPESELESRRRKLSLLLFSPGAKNPNIYKR